MQRHARQSRDLGIAVRVMRHWRQKGFPNWISELSWASADNPCTSNGHALDTVTRSKH